MADGVDFPLLKMTYGYEISGTLKGVKVEESHTYSYSKDKGYQEGEAQLESFEYFTEVKVDARGNRAMQTLYPTADKTEMI